MAKKTETIFGMGVVAADVYVKKYDNAYAQRKAAEKTLYDVKPGTARYRAEKAQIEADFQSEVEKIRKEVSGEFSAAMESTRNRIALELQASTWEKENMDTLKYFSDIPLSQQEINVLGERYGGGYWSDRLLKQLAEKNNCEYGLGGAEIGERLEILDELQNRLNALMSGYDTGGINAGILSAIHESQIYKLEERFTKGYTNMNLSPGQRADRAVAMTLGQAGFMERAVTLANAYRNADTETRQHILLMCADDSRLTDIAKMAGLDERVTAFKENGLSDMKEAVKTVKAAQSADSVIGAAAMLDNAKENPFIAELVKDTLEVTDSQNFRQAVEKSDVGDLLKAKAEIEAEGAGKPGKE